MNRISLIRRHHLIKVVRTLRHRCMSTSSKGVEALEEPTGSEEDIDFFGIGKIDKKKDIAGEYVLDGKDPLKKYEIFTQSRTRMENEESLITNTIGTVRLDSKNMPKYHGQFDPSNTRLAYDAIEKEFDRKYNQVDNPEEATSSPGQLFEEQFFSGVTDANIQSTEPTSNTVENPIEIEYFGNLKDMNDSVNQSVSEKPEEPVNWIEAQFFENYFPRAEPGAVKQPLGQYHFKFSGNFLDWVEEQRKIQLEESIKQVKPMEKRKYRINVMEGINYAKATPLKDLDDIREELNEIQAEIQELKEAEQFAAESTKEEEEGFKDTGIKQQKSSEADEEPSPVSAREYVEMLRTGKVQPTTKQYENVQKSYRLAGEELFDKFDGQGHELDSKGYLTYRDAVLDLSQLRKAELLWMLKDRIVFNDAGLVVLNKPYGLVIQGTKGDRNKSIDHILFDMLPEFSELLFNEKIVKNPADSSRPAKLYPLHRIDKEVTGLLIMATNPSTASRVQQMFAQRKIEKEYLAVTRNIPDHNEGIIDIPIEKGSIDGRERMVLRPELEEEYRRLAKPSMQAKRAITHYRVLHSNINASLLSVRPETGVKHQIRAHLGLGLRCPILGDHKYTNVDRLVPQRLPSEMLVALNVRQSKVRNIPMLLHAYRYAVPDLSDQGLGTIYLKAPIPKHFRNICGKLKLPLNI